MVGKPIRKAMKTGVCAGFEVWWRTEWDDDPSIVMRKSSSCRDELEPARSSLSVGTSLHFALTAWQLRSIMAMYRLSTSSTRIYTSSRLRSTLAITPRHASGNPSQATRNMRQAKEGYPAEASSLLLGVMSMENTVLGFFDKRTHRSRQGFSKSKARRLFLWRYSQRGFSWCSRDRNRFDESGSQQGSGSQVRTTEVCRIKGRRT